MRINGEISLLSSIFEGFLELDFVLTFYMPERGATPKCGSFKNVVGKGEFVHNGSRYFCCEMCKLLLS